MTAKGPTFARWLRITGRVTGDEMFALTGEWQRARMSYTEHKVYTTRPITWDQFLAGKYPRQFITYQAFLRLTGAAPTLRKD
jgi:hypothetical protein